MNCDSCGQPLPVQREGMCPPRDVSLPFFAYGVFKPGELAFLQIKEFVLDCSRTSIPGQLKVRDGLPIAALDAIGEIDGVLIAFMPGFQESAYRRIADLEPEKQYRWETRAVGAQKYNVLAGVSPNKGSQSMDEPWDGRNDPLFTSALEVVEQTLNDNRAWRWDLKPLFRLEMAYLLLWTSIERYASLRYHLRAKATQKVWKIASEPAFRRALGTVEESRSVQRADDPTKKCTLNPKDPEEAMAYYYQVRSNLVHRGKGALLDHERLMKSLEELLKVFKVTLCAAFDESQWAPLNS